MRYLTAIVKSMRPVQWIKNFFVFAGLIFSQEFFDLHKVLLSFAAFAIFSQTVSFFRSIVIMKLFLM